MKETLLILASSSPRRQELIRSFGLPVEIVPSDADETADAGWSPEEMAERLSLRKAEAVRARLGGDRRGLIVGSDTIVVLDREVLGKPQDDADAERMLTLLQGREHQVFSGIAVVDAVTGRSAVAHRMTRVWMKPLERERIKRYIATGEPRDKAGAYGIQGIGAVLIERMDGDYFNVVGLPVALLAELLESFEVRVL
jgi:septum formation protein